MTGLRFDHYQWAGGREAMLRFGPDDGPRAILALPLFEEANRTRAFAVAICRALTSYGIGSVLPDLPGTGESLVQTFDATLDAMRAAYRALVGLERRVHAIGIRSGALLDGDADMMSRWHLAPQTGEALLRDLRRIRLAASAGRVGIGARSIPAGDYAGNSLSATMLADLGDAVPSGDGARRIVRLDTELGVADRKLPGAPPWRRAEPANDPALAAAMAEDIAVWIATCGR